MLEAAVAVADDVHQEHVAVERRAGVRRSGEQIALPLAHTREIAREALDVTAMAAAHCDVVRDTACGERHEREVRHFDRVVDELLVARGAIEPESVWRRAGAR